LSRPRDVKLPQAKLQGTKHTRRAARAAAISKGAKGRLLKAVALTLKFTREQGSVDDIVGKTAEEIVEQQAAVKAGALQAVVGEVNVAQQNWLTAKRKLRMITALSS